MGFRTGGVNRKLQKAKKAATGAAAEEAFEDAKAEFEKAKDIGKKALAKVKMLEAAKAALKAGVRVQLPFGV